MLLSALLANVPTDVLHADVNIADLCLDSRFVKPGDLFFALPGTQLDGSHFIHEAINNGASAVLVEANQTLEFTQQSVPIIPIPQLKKITGDLAARFYGYPAKAMKIIGVTGTSGKTSCSHFIAAALMQLNVPCGIMGTLGNGMYGQVKSGTLTTPDVITVQKTFADFLRQGAKAVAMEVSSHSLDQGRVNGIEFDLGIFTNLSRDHLDYHETMEAYGAAKKRLFAQTRAAIINQDDPFGKQLIAEFSGQQKVISYGLHAGDVVANNVQLNHSGVTATILTPWGSGRLHAALLGEFNVSNLLASISALCMLGHPLHEVLACVPKFQSVPGRMQVLGGKDKPLVVVDYAHKPDALEKVLIALRAHCSGKLFCLFGCGGDRDRGKRPMMAKIAEQYADQVIVTDDNPRHEDPAQIVTDIVQGFSDPAQIIIEHNRSKAIRDVIQCATTGDCVLVAGKGAETYQQIGDEKFPFNDIEKVRACLDTVYRC